MSAKSTKQMCYNCRKRPVRPIRMRPSIFGDTATGFCSTLCAVANAHYYLYLSEESWCSACGEYVSGCEHEDEDLP